MKVMYAVFPMIGRSTWYLKEKGNINGRIGIIDYIATKCYVVNEDKENNKYEVIFPYQYREDFWEMVSLTSDNNIIVVDDLYKTWQEAHECATNERIKILDGIKENARYRLDYMHDMDYYDHLEYLINRNMQDIVVGEVFINEKKLTKKIVMPSCVV